MDGGCDVLRGQLRTEADFATKPQAATLTMRCFEVRTSDQSRAADAVAAWIQKLSPGYAVDRSRPDLGSEGPGGQQLRDLYTRASVSGIKTVPDQLYADYDVHSRTRPATGTVWVTVTVAALHA